MKYSERLVKAVKKLVTAFHDGTLDAMDCKHCAVGNMCDNNPAWAWRGLGWLGVAIGYPSRIPENYDFGNQTGYSNLELVQIECLFIFGIRTGREVPIFNNNISQSDVIEYPNLKLKQIEDQYKGLVAVIDYLLELDGITEPLNYEKLFMSGELVAQEELELITQ